MILPGIPNRSTISSLMNLFTAAVLIFSTALATGHFFMYSTATSIILFPAFVNGCIWPMASIAITSNGFDATIDSVGLDAYILILSPE
ncbi:hypothetical protein AYI69_g1908 [Smittium culicis]|uniref:Uncharacterized protein n=1 Tax=Smittium culicis TaxID=133412 RepID=A0A1R1YNX7_9FUNG|nr:hypothetical protein AYI69_g1908 [Smittium culicis]